MIVRDVLNGACAVLLLLTGFILKAIYEMLKEVLKQQRVCPERFADRARNDAAQKEFYDSLEDLNVRVSVLEKARSLHCGEEDIRA